MGARVVTGLAFVALAGCAGSTSDKAGGMGARKPLVLTLATFTSSGEVNGFAAEVSRLSGGTIRIDVKSAWRYGQHDYETALIGDVRAGKADLGVAGSRAWDSVGVVSLRALGAPLLIDSYALQERVLRSSMIAPMLNGLAPLELVGLGVLPGPLHYPIGIARPLLGPSDYAGLRIGVQQSRVGSETIRALGATPVWLPVGGPIAGLGGTEQGISGLAGDQYHQGAGYAAGYLTANVALWPRSLVVFANDKAFAKLPRAQQRILRQAIADDASAETKLVLDGDRTDTATLCRSHRLRLVIATRADLAALHRALQPIYDQLERDAQTRRDITQIEAMRGSVAAEPAPSCIQASQLTPPAGPLGGVYQFTLSLADLSAAGADLSELNPSNVGKLTFVFDRGRFATTTENPQTCIWGYGTLTVKGDTLTLLFTDGGGIAPPGATNKPGELFTFTWSLYRDELTLGRVAGAVSPTPGIAKAWRRVSTAPSRRFLSGRCPPPANALPR